jgi:hypothetical protein
MNEIVTLISAALLVIGSLFALVASIGPAAPAGSLHAHACRLEGRHHGSHA